MKNSNIMVDDDDFTSLPSVEFKGGAPVYQVNGFWLRPEFIQAARQMSRHFKPLPTDIILASFPKTGTTWLKTLLYSIVNRSSRDSVLVNHPHLLVPVLEIQMYGPKAEPHENFPGINSSRRIVATHLPYALLSDSFGSLDCRVVYVTRNPKDTLVSMWHFQQKSNTYSGPWLLEDAVNKFCDRGFSFGPFHDHVLGYREESLKNPNKVFFVTYEDLKSDCKTQVKRLADFLQCSFDEEEVLDEIVNNCSFDKLKNYDINKSNEEILWLKFPQNSFYRKGEVGDHKNFLTGDDKSYRQNHQGEISRFRFHVWSLAILFMQF